MSVWRKLHKSVRFMLAATLLIAILAPLLANDRPILAAKNGKWSLPFLSNVYEAQQTEPYDWAVRPLIPYRPTNTDLKNAQSVGPFDSQMVINLYYRHWLGTDELGRDILAGMIYGCRTALIVSCCSILIAALIGIFLGSMAGYWGDDGLKWSFLRTSMTLIGLGLACFYAFYTPLLEGISSLPLQWLIGLLLIIGIAALFHLLAKQLEVRFQLRRQSVPIDLIISRVIEIMVSLPMLFVLISVSAILKPSIWNIVWIIGFTAWTGIARFSRAEMLRLKGVSFIESAKAMGLTDLQILLKHALPNVIGPISVTIAFGMAGAVLAESTLSFLGVGLPSEEVSWGSMLAQVRQSPSAWWMAVFPGGAIFLMVMLYNRIAAYISEYK